MNIIIAFSSFSYIITGIVIFFFFFLDHKHGRHQEDFDIQPSLKHQYPVGRPFMKIEKTLGDRAFSNASTKIWNSAPAIIKVYTFKTLLIKKLTILEKRLIYNFFLVFHIVYIFAFYCQFKIVNR